MREHHVDRPGAPAAVVAGAHSQLRQLEHFVFSDVIDGTQRAGGVRRGLKVPTTVVSSVVDARDARNAHAADGDHAGAPEVVDVGGDPPAIVQLLQVVGRLVVPADEQSQDWGDGLAAVVPVEGGHGQVLARDIHGFQVLLVAHRLEVPAANEQVDFLALFLLHPGDGRVDLVQLPVAASFHDDAQVGVLHFAWCGGACGWGGRVMMGRGGRRRRLVVDFWSCCCWGAVASRWLPV